MRLKPQAKKALVYVSELTSGSNNEPKASVELGVDPCQGSDLEFRIQRFGYARFRERCPLQRGTKTQKAKGIPDTAEIFTQDNPKTQNRKPQILTL